MANLYLAQECIDHQEYAAAFEILHAAVRDDAGDAQAMTMLHELEVLLTPSTVVSECTPILATSNFWPDGGNIPASSVVYGATYIPKDTPYRYGTSFALRYGTTLAIAPQLRGLPALEAQMQTLGIVERYTQSDVDQREAHQREFDEYLQRLRMQFQEKRNRQLAVLHTLQEIAVLVVVVMLILCATFFILVALL